MEQLLQTAVVHMRDEIAAILTDCSPHIYLHGSAAMDDYRDGWSDIDLLVLTDHPIAPEQADTLLMLRQRLTEITGDPVFRRFEGGMQALDALRSNTSDLVVYWGTSGQRITAHYQFDPFSLWTLQHCGVLLHGTDIRHLLPSPDFSVLRGAVAQHLSTIRQHGRGERSLYTFGWLLDIARGLYTLRFGGVAPKTAAGQWALAEGLCPDATALSLALEVRLQPERFRDAPVLLAAESMTAAIQNFADVLEAELNR